MKPPSFCAKADNPEQWSLENTSASIAVFLSLLTTGFYGYGAFFIDKTPLGFWQWLIGTAFFLTLAGYLKAGMGDTGFKELLEILKGIVQ